MPIGRRIWNCPHCGAEVATTDAAEHGRMIMEHKATHEESDE